MNWLWQSLKSAVYWRISEFPVNDKLGEIIYIDYTCQFYREIKIPFCTTIELATSLRWLVFFLTSKVWNSNVECSVS